MTLPELQTPSFESPDEEPDPLGTGFKQAYDIAANLVDSLWSRLYDAEKSRDNDTIVELKEHLRGAYYFMAEKRDAVLASVKQSDLTAASAQMLTVIIDQTDCCEKLRNKLKL